METGTEEDIQAPGGMDAGDIGYDPAPAQRIPPAVIGKGPGQLDEESLPAPYQMTGAEAKQRRQLQFIEDVYNRLPAAEAGKVIEQATQLEGRLGYDADLAAGVNPQEALAKWGPKLFHSQPAALLNALRPPAKLGETLDLGGGRTGVRVGPNHLQLFTQPQTGPIQGRPLLDEGGNVVGNDFEGAHHPKFNTSQGGLTINNQIALARMKQKIAEKAVDAAKYARGTAQERKQMMDQAMKKLSDADTALEQLGSNLRSGTQSKGRRSVPKIGDVVGNHQFKGGDPKDQNSWEPLQGPVDSGDSEEINTDTEE